MTRKRRLFGLLMSEENNYFLVLLFLKGFLCGLCSIIDKQYFQDFYFLMILQNVEFWVYFLRILFIFKLLYNRFYYQF